jgi:serine acetyltransferase
MFWGFEIHRSARIGFSLLLCKKLAMLEGSRIGHLNWFRGMDSVRLSACSTISHLNWFTAFPTDRSDFFSGIERSATLLLGQHAAITSRHLIDCTDAVTIADYALVAGYRSQILTHSIDLGKNRQDCAPIEIGCYSFIGSGVIILKGASVPEKSIVSAGSVYRGRFAESHWLYSGVPAVPVKQLDLSTAFFSRTSGNVY